MIRTVGPGHEPSRRDTTLTKPCAPTPPDHDLSFDGLQVIEAMPHSAALIGPDGTILHVNESWRRFARRNGAGLFVEAGAGIDYLEVCRNAGAVEVLAGVQAVLAGRLTQFEFEYPCHSPDQSRWLLLQAMTLGALPGRALLMHVDVTSRKLAEMAAQEKCVLLQQTLDTVETLIVSLDREGCVTSINRCGARMLGRDPADIVGASWFATCLPQPEGMTRIYPVFRQIMDGGLEQVEYFENEILAADGSRRMLAWHNAYLKGPDGRLAGTLCAGNDVTEHKQLEQALQRSNDEMCRAQAIAQVGNWWLDLGSQRLSWSDEVHRIFGVEKGSHLTYDIFLERVHPDDRAEVDARWRKALAGAGYDIEHRIVVDGEIKWLRERARLELDGQGRVVGAYGTTQDITLGKLTALALGESERLLREAQEAARIGTYTYHVDDDHWTCSAVLDDILGIGPAYPRTAQSWIMMVHPDDREAMGSYLADIVGARVASFDREYRIRRPVDGLVRWLHGYGQVDKAADGRVARMFGTIMDVTDRKEAEIALRETRERYRRLFLLNPLPMWVFDEETLRFLEVNDAAIAAYGYSRDAFLAMSILDIRLDTDLQALLDPVHRGGLEQTHGEVWRHRRQNGEVMDVALWSESIDYEGRRARLVICEDVTLKQALEAALMRKANLADQLKNIAATVPGAIFAFLRHEDGVYSFPYIDGKQLEALGFSAEDFSSDARPLIGLVHPDDISALLESIEMSARAMAAWHGQFRILHPHLGVRWIEGDSIPQLCADGSVLWHGYLSDATERIEATRRLEQSHAQIQALLAHMEVVREEERTRIARELHDELGQTLTAIRMNLRQLSSLAGPDHPEMDSRLNDVEAIVEEAMLSVRRISQELHPRILDTLGLGGAIEWETGEFRKRMGIRCRCVVPQADIDLPETFKTHIYRLFQEAMTNISRHARATAVDVTLSCDGNILSLQVADNGVGIRSDALTGNSLGLTSMKERALQVGGVLSITTHPAIRGTCVSLRVALTDAGRESQ